MSCSIELLSIVDHYVLTDEVTSVRTSAHAWCIDECYQDPTVASVTQRIADVTGIPHANYEAFQLLKVRLLWLCMHVGSYFSLKVILLPNSTRLDSSIYLMMTVSIITTNRLTGLDY